MFSFLMSKTQYLTIAMQCCGVVGRIPAFQPVSPGSIPDGVRDFNLYPWTVCVLCLYSVLCCLWR